MLPLNRSSSIDAEEELRIALLSGARVTPYLHQLSAGDVVAKHYFMLPLSASKQGNQVLVIYRHELPGSPPRSQVYVRILQKPSWTVIQERHKRNYRDAGMVTIESCSTALGTSIEALVSQIGHEAATAELCDTVLRSIKPIAEVRASKLDLLFEAEEYLKSTDDIVI